MLLTSFDVLQIAVNLARDRNIQRADKLRAALSRQLPSHQQEIDEAMALWSSHLTRYGA